MSKMEFYMTDTLSHEVFCINPEAQVQFHLGYEYDENDVHDVLLLCRTFNLEIPEQYKTHI